MVRVTFNFPLLPTLSLSDRDIGDEGFFNGKGSTTCELGAAGGVGEAMDSSLSDELSLLSLELELLLAGRGGNTGGGCSCRDNRGC